nr:methyltransferase domain-containing protein [uncultured Emticicia sp.]
MNFKNRSYQAELLDNDEIPTEDLYRNLQELDFINSYLGGHKVILQGIKYFINSIQNKYSENIFNSEYSTKKHISKTIINTIFLKQKDFTIFSNFSEILNIYEIGSGGGDNLRAVSRFLNKISINHSLMGVDLKEDCARFAENFEPSNTAISYEIADYQMATFPKGQPHIIFNSLFCHHFKDDDLVNMLQWMHKNSTIGFIIADLHRHPLAYYSIKWITALFSKSYLVKNDAPLSVLRGFSRRELEILLVKADIKNYKISWKWAFRWLILVEKQT